MTKNSSLLRKELDCRKKAYFLFFEQIPSIWEKKDFLQKMDLTLLSTEYS
jgi:hypothetical protein